MKIKACALTPDYSTCVVMCVVRYIDYHGGDEELVEESAVVRH